MTCGGGIQFRNRTCDGPFYNGTDCSGDDVENRTCSDFNCPGRLTRNLDSLDFYNIYDLLLNQIQT